MTPPEHILIVDDEPVNIKVLQRKLEKQGYRITLASNGMDCLIAVDEDPPDLILLDIMMPDMDGYETCRRLKQNPASSAIPVIFITAKNERSDKIQGLDSGAIDYVTKPIDLEETLARIRTHLRLEFMHRENLELEQRLFETRRAAAVGSVSQGIAHNLNNLLGVVVGYLDLMRIRINDPEKLGKGLDSMERAVNRMIELVRQLSSITGDEALPTVPVQIEDAVRRATRRWSERSQVPAERVRIENTLPSNYRVETSLEAIEDSIERLIANAWESYSSDLPEADRNVTVRLGFGPGGEEREVRVDVIDRGLGVDPGVTDHIFDPFVSTKNSVGRGLGLTIVKHSVQNLGGAISIEPNQGDNGTVASIRIPVKPEER